MHHRGRRTDDQERADLPIALRHEPSLRSLLSKCKVLAVADGSLRDALVAAQLAVTVPLLAGRRLRAGTRGSLPAYRAREGAVDAGRRGHALPSTCRSARRMSSFQVCTARLTAACRWTRPACRRATSTRRASQQTLNPERAASTPPPALGAAWLTPDPSAVDSHRQNWYGCTSWLPHRPPPAGAGSVVNRVRRWLERRGSRAVRPRAPARAPLSGPGQRAGGSNQRAGAATTSSRLGRESLLCGRKRPALHHVDEGREVLDGSVEVDAQAVHVGADMGHMDGIGLVLGLGSIAAKHSLPHSHHPWQQFA